MENQTTIFDMLYPKKTITKPIRLIELFGGYGSQALALKYLGVDFEHWKLVEWAVKSIKAYKDIHFPNDDTNYSKDLTKEQIIEYLTEKGISNNYNEPMFKAQIQRLNENTLRGIYNDIQTTNNLVNIQQVKGKDLEIVDTDKYEYIMTYSFPCQDLSLAGKGKGMSDTSTRSGLLWEVERILSECENKPQILLMENVPQVHSEDNLQDFNKWKLRLEELGYKNYFKDLIATDYGIPQTRNRCFMISLLGDYSYTFPKPIPLKLKLKDILEDNVPEKYYLSDKMKDYIFSENDKYKVNKSSLQLDRDIACSKTTREGNTRADTSDYITCLLKNKGQELSKETDTANTLMARDYKGFGNQEMNAVIELKNIHKTLRETLETNEIKDGVSYIDAYKKNPQIFKTKNVGNVWEIPFNSGKKDIHGFGRKETKSKWGHSGFPVELPETCILLSTNENDIVLDMFMGSGTTGVACKKLNRHFIGIDLDKNYCDIARKRIEESKGG